MDDEALETKIRKQFLREPVDSYKVLTFGELQAGDKYIGLPLPGDNKGHGGFVGTHWLFEKTVELKETNTLYNTVRLKDSCPSTIPDNMAVIRVE